MAYCELIAWMVARRFQNLRGCCPFFRVAEKRAVVTQGSSNPNQVHPSNLLKGQRKAFVATTTQQSSPIAREQAEHLLAVLWVRTMSPLAVASHLRHLCTYPFFSVEKGEWESMQGWLPQN